MLNQYNNLSLNELETRAYSENNLLALAIYDELESEVQNAVSEATTPDDDDYTAADRVEAVEYLLTEAVWLKNESGYYVQGFHEDTHPNHHHITITKRGSAWQIEIHCDGYGETVYGETVSGNFKKAQTEAIKAAIRLLKKGHELLVF